MIVEWYQVHILCEYASVESCGPWSLFPLRNAHVAFLPEFISAAVVQLTCGVRLFATPRTAACQASLSFTISWSLLKFMPMELVMPSSHLILCRPLLLLPLVFPSIRVSAELALCIRCQSVRASASASVLPVNAQDWSPLGWTGWSPCSPRDSQESLSSLDRFSLIFSLLPFHFLKSFPTLGFFDPPVSIG